jgi:hypothetical protein
MILINLFLLVAKKLASRNGLYFLMRLKARQKRKSLNTLPLAAMLRKERFEWKQIIQKQ